MEECDNKYIIYLIELQKAIAERYGKSNDYIAKYWLRIYLTEFSDEEFSTLFEQYKNAMLEGIKRIHSDLQGMVDDIDFEPVKLPILEGYFYQEEKIHYLYLSEECIEDVFKHKDDDFICTDMFSKMLKIMDDCIENNVGQEELYNTTLYFETKTYGTKPGVIGSALSDSEWARLQLKVMEPVLGKYVKFDYELNDWKLYMQVQTAVFLMSKDEKNAS